MKTLTVAIFDSNTLFRQGLARILPADFNVVAQAPLDALADLGTGAADIILMDADSASAAIVIASAKAMQPRAKIVYLTAGLDEDRLRTVLEAGADAYLTHNRPVEALSQALRLVALGEKVFPCDLARLVAIGSGIGARGISSRERQIVQSLMVGESNRQIASRLGIAEATVKVQVKGLLRKLNASNRTQAAIWGMNHGMSPPTSAGVLPAPETRELDACDAENP